MSIDYSVSNPHGLGVWLLLWICQRGTPFYPMVFTDLYSETHPGRNNYGGELLFRILVNGASHRSNGSGSQLAASVASQVPG